MEVKRSGVVEGGEVGEECGVDFADEVALEAAHDLLLGEALFGASFDVGLGGRVVAHPAQGDGVEGAVGLSVAAAVESVAVGAAGAGRQGRGAAQVGQGGFGAQPVGVVSGGGQQLPGDFGADAGQGGQPGCGAGHEWAQPLVRLGDFGGQCLDPQGGGGEGCLGRLDGVTQAGVV